VGFGGDVGKLENGDVMVRTVAKSRPMGLGFVGSVPFGRSLGETLGWVSNWTMNWTMNWTLG
jgi:hypothetical protein